MMLLPIALHQQDVAALKLLTSVTAVQRMQAAAERDLSHGAAIVDSAVEQ